MKVQAFNKEVVEEKVVTLRLVETSAGVELHAVDQSGERKDFGIIALVSNEGTLVVRSFLSKKLGLKVKDPSRSDCGIKTIFE